MIGATVTIRDTGEIKILKTFDVAIQAGILPEEAEQVHGEGPLTIGEIGTIHEFGAGPIPARMWLRKWVELKQAHFMQRIRKELQTMVRTQTFIEAPLNAIATEAERSIKGRIIGGHIEPRNAPRTLQRKAPENRPLIETKQFLNAIKARMSATFGNGQKLDP
jgi:hypothetical protein